MYPALGDASGLSCVRKQRLWRRLQPWLCIIHARTCGGTAAQDKGREDQDEGCDSVSDVLRSEDERRTRAQKEALTRLQLLLRPAWQCTSTLPPDERALSMKAVAVSKWEPMSSSSTSRSGHRIQVAPSASSGPSRSW